MSTGYIETRDPEAALLKRLLLVCGILSSVYYIALNIFIPMLWSEYSVVTQTVSELSAIGAPTRQIWVWLGMLYIFFFASFGFGVLKFAGNNRSLRIVGRLIIAYCIVNFYWPPMHLREALASDGGTISDTLHLVWAAIAVIFMMFMMGFGATVFGKEFRYYTIATMVTQILFGILTGMESPNIAHNLSTPMIGIWERINIGVFMIWIIVFAVQLLRKEIHQTETIGSSKNKLVQE